MTRRSILIAAAVLLIAAAAGGATYWFKRKPTVTVTVETIRTRDLEAIVSASGKIQPKRLVNISADTAGRVVNLAVNEGDRVKTGQFLMQIDPRSLQTRVESGQAALQSGETVLAQLRQSLETSRVQLAQAQQNLRRQQDLWTRQLTTREALERAENEVRSAESVVGEREQQMKAQELRLGESRAALNSARLDLSKVRIESPIDGIVTRRNIQEGETAVVGTMNNAGTVLLTIADMSVIQAEVEVDETNIPSVKLGQPATVTIDALPDRTFRGHVAEIGNSPIQNTSQGSSQGSTSTQATNFKVTVVVDEDVPDVRPGFTCTADVTTATRHNVTAVPIPAVAVRELIYDANGQFVRPPPDEERSTKSDDATVMPTELEPGQTRREEEGVFLLQGTKVVFTPIKIGIAGERYFEVLESLKPGDMVVTGPYNSVRNMADGQTVKLEEAKNK